MQQAVNLRVLEFRPASPDYPFGSDGTGRNMWRLMILGGRVNVPVALAAALAAVAAAWALGTAARRWSRGPAALSGLRTLLSIYPAIMWGVVAVFLAGRGTLPLAVGLFFAVLPAALEPFAPPEGRTQPALWWRRTGKGRAVLLLGTALASAAYSFLVVVHMAFIGVGSRFAGTEWSAALGETFARQHPDWTLASAPALALMLTALALFVPGQVMLNLAARGAPESPPGAGRSG
jgi:peptide/nickel transport system permease protein